MSYSLLKGLKEKMSKFIHSYKIGTLSCYELRVTEGSQVLSVELIEDVPHLWISVNNFQGDGGYKDKVKKIRVIASASIDDGVWKRLSYIGRFRLRKTYHVFEENE